MYGNRGFLLLTAPALLLAGAVAAAGLVPFVVFALLCSSAVMVGFAVVISLRYYDRLSALIPPALVWTVLAAFYLVLALPLTVTLLRPLWSRARAPGATTVATDAG